MPIDPYEDPSRKGGSIQTYTGNIFYPLDPRMEDIQLEDVAHGLSNKARFTGHTRKFYSTAEHAVRVSWFLRDAGESLMVQYVGLHHDDTDAYLPDVPTPLKILPEFAWFRELEQSLQALCFKKFECVGVDGTAYQPVKLADVVLLLTEKRDLMHSKVNSNWGKKYEQRYCVKAIPSPYFIEPWTPERAKSEYLTLHSTLRNQLRFAEP